VPSQKLSRNIQVLDLPGFPPVRLGILYRDEPAPGETAREALLQAIQHEAAHFR
jgi:hypothetical protein